MKIIFFGTPTFASDILAYLLSHQVEVVAIVTKPDKAKGRSSIPVPTPVKLVAHAQVPPIPCFQPPIVSVPEFAPQLLSYQADLFVVVAYGEIIKQHLLDMPKLGCINVHASLLPKYRGAAPIQRAIMNGETKTGVTIMHMVKKMDAGDMIKSVEVPIAPQDTFKDVESELCRAGAEALLSVIHDFEKGDVSRQPQDHSQATLAPKIELEDCEIVWTRPAQALHNLVRAVTPDPGAWCKVSVRGQDRHCKILFSSYNPHLCGIPGQILTYGSEGLTIACGQGSLRCELLQLEGKKVMTAKEFMCGIPKDQLLFCNNFS